jgi:cellulose synthase/poly-beta-1,6-N-acetylglucosamine synthase-like glycosyltransferase
MVDVLRVAEYMMMFAVLYFTVVLLLIYLQNRNRMWTRKNKKFEPTVSFIIPAYNEGEYIGKVIESVLAVDYPKRKLEVVVVNDGSTDGTSERVRSIAMKDGRVKLFDKSNAGKANALNYGIKRARGEIVITLDADSYVAKNCVRILMSHFDDDVAAVTSAVKVKDRKNMSFIESLQRVEYLFTIFNRRLFSFINSVYVTPGPLSAFRKEVFDEVGGFDPNNIMEDQEIALRIQSANYRIVSCMDAVVYTEVPKDFNSLMKQRIRWHRGGFRNILKYSYMVHPKYGDFGAFVMPYSFASIFLLFLVFWIVAVAVTKMSGFYFLEPLLSVEPIHIISAIVLVITLAWTFVALSQVEKKPNIKNMLLYTITYCYLITLFMTIAVFKELKGDPTSW